MRAFLAKVGNVRLKWPTALLLVFGGGALIAAFLIGVSDNLPGLALVYAAVTAFLLAWAHTWRSLKRFLVLLGLSLLGFPLAVVLHNLFYALAELAAEFAGLAWVLGMLEVAFFLVAILVCPPGILVGAVGSVVLAIHRFRQNRSTVRQG